MQKEKQYKIEYSNTCNNKDHQIFSKESKYYDINLGFAPWTFYQCKSHGHFETSTVCQAFYLKPPK